MLLGEEKRRMRARRLSALGLTKSNVRGYEDGIALSAVLVAFGLLCLCDLSGHSPTDRLAQVALLLASCSALIFGFRAYRRRSQV